MTQNWNVTKRSIDIKCGNGKHCRVAAEMHNEDIEEDGYLLSLGDGKTYGKYVNTPLQPEYNYSVHVAITALLQEV